VGFEEVVDSVMDHVIYLLLLVDHLWVIEKAQVLHVVDLVELLL
jgi:hypothetical protein